MWRQFVPLVINCSTDNRHSHWKLARTCIGALPLPDFSATIAAKFQLAAYPWKLDFPRARPESTVPRWVPLTSWVPIGSLFTFQHRLPGAPTWPTLEHLMCPVDIVNVEQWWTINMIARGGNLYTSFHTTAAAVIGLGPKCWNRMWTFIAIEHGS